MAITMPANPNQEPWPAQLHQALFLGGRSVLVFLDVDQHASYGPAISIPGVPLWIRDGALTSERGQLEGSTPGRTFHEGHIADDHYVAVRTSAQVPAQASTRPGSLDRCGGALLEQYGGALSVVRPR